MKKIFVLVGLLISLVSAAQPGYTTINARYSWLAGKFSALHVPGFSTTPSLQTGQWPGDGAVGIDTILNKFFFYSSGTWFQAGGSFYDSTLMASVKRLKDTAAAIRADIAGAVPGIDAVIAADPTLTASRNIDGGGFGFNFGIVNTFTTTLQTIDFGTQATFLLSPSGSTWRNANSGTSAYGLMFTGDNKALVAAFDGSGTPDSIFVGSNNARIAVNGVLQIKDASLSGSTVGDVWTLTSTTTGAGEWAAGGGGGWGTTGTIATLTGDGTVDLDGNILSFVSGGNDYISIDPTTDAENVTIAPFNATAGGNQPQLQLAATDVSSFASLSASFDGGASIATIQAGAGSGVSFLTYTATTHTFTGSTIFNGTARLKSFTVATLPAGTAGDMAYVTDALLPSFLTTVAGGGAVVTPVFYDGTNWKAF